MSETTEPTEGQPAAEPEPTATPAPAPEPASETEASEQTPEQKAEARDKEDRRIAQLRARLGAAEREREAQRAELEHYRRQVAQQAPQQETPEQAMARIEREADARAEERLLVRRFHEEGYASFRDWDQKRKDLVEMGADAGIATLLVEMPGGVRVAAALAEDPSELKRIADIPSERGRAIALGKYAASIENGEAAPARATPQVTRAPAPIRPVTGRASPTFNPYTASGQQLVDRWSKEDLDARSRR